MANLPNGKFPAPVKHKKGLVGPILNFVIPLLQYDKGIYHPEATNVLGAPFNIIGQEEFTVGQVGTLMVKFQ